MSRVIVLARQMVRERSEGITYIDGDLGGRRKVGNDIVG